MIMYRSETKNVNFSRRKVFQWSQIFYGRNTTIFACFKIQ